MLRNSRHLVTAVILCISLLMVVATACAPSAAPTATPTKAAPAATPTTAAAAPTVAATKPAASPTGAQPAATPTTAAAKPSGAPIKIGVLLPLSGPMASLGVVHKIAVQLAEEDVNASGGINGAPLQLVIEDSPFDPRQAVTLVRKLAEQDKVLAIAGPYASSEFEAAAPLANDLKLIVVSSALKPGIAEKNRPYSFQMNLSDDVAQPPAVDTYKKLYPNVKRVVITGDTKEAVSEYMVKTFFPKILKEKGLEVIDTVAFESGITDFSAIVSRIKGLNPDGIVLSAVPAVGLGIAKELERQAVKAPVLTSAAITGGPFVQNAGTSVNGWIMPGVMDFESSDPMVRNFVTRFFKAAESNPAVTPKPQHIVTESLYYDIIMIFTDMLRKNGIKPDSPLQDARDKLKDGFQNLKGYKGTVGIMNMAPTGQVERQPQVVFTGDNGKWKVIR